MALDRPTDGEAHANGAAPPLSDTLAGLAAELQRRSVAIRSAELGCSWARLGLGFAAIVACFLPYLSSNLKTILVVGLVALFAIVVRWHARYRRQRIRLEGQLLVVNESLRRAGGRVVTIRSYARPADAVAAALPAEPSEAASPLTAQELDDLDIYAEPVGLFGLLNRCSTQLGARRLRDIVEHPHLTAGPIRLRQKCVAALAGDVPARTAAMGAVTRLRSLDGAVDRLVAALKIASPLPHPARCALLRIYSIVSGIAIVVGTLAAIDGHPLAALVLVLMPINFAIYSYLSPMLELHRAPWPDLSPVTGEVAEAAAGAAGALPPRNQPDEIAALRTDLHGLAQHALPLAFRLGWFDVGGILQLLLNACMLYDLHVVAAVTRRALEHGEALLRGLCAMAQLEALLSLACFASESAGPLCYPVITDGGPEVHVRGGCHPLIDPARAVPNDVRLDAGPRLLLVTGSNMSGKSTYLRMTGVSCLLAQIGAPVLAESMSLLPVCLVTDLNVRDKLGAAESYFLAEVRHVRRLLDPPAGCACVLGLLDEPFRGTNSDERFACTAAVLEFLNQDGKLSIVSTHEQQLAAMVEQMSGAMNCHFHESLGPAGLSFDYRLNSGRATTRNALHVLAREGYPQVILDRAREICAGEAAGSGAG